MEYGPGEEGEGERGMTCQTMSTWSWSGSSSWDEK